MHEHINKYPKMKKKKKKKPAQGTTKHAQQAQKEVKHVITQSGELIML